MRGGMAKDMAEIAKKTKRFVERDLPRIIAVEGIAQMKENFREEGFEDRSRTRWKPRKTTDSRGRNNTVYRTNRVGKAGSPNAYGRRIRGRKILTGHNTSANKLQNSFKTRVSPQQVAFYTYKNYAQVHNEGLGNMPKREYIGPSYAWEMRVQRKAKKSLDKIYT